MKKFLYIFGVLAVMMLAGNTAKAQVGLDTMDVPMGCFEQWNDVPTETVSLIIMSLPVGYDYQLPEGWSIPKYEVNETLSYSGFNIPIHANIPLAKIWNDTVNMPQGHGALVTETFMLEDVINPTVYSLASSMLDSTLTNTVLPTIASTGEIKLDKLIELVEPLLDNDEDLSWMLGMLDTLDINEYVTGGFALNGFEPKRLVGYYKYIAANLDEARDNGAVVALGTRYDTLTHRRMLVGAGSKNLFQLYDTVNYESFYMDYFSLSEYFPAGYDFQEADSMIVLVVSSASDKARARGSRLYVDSLRLVSKNVDCGHIINFATAEVGGNIVRLAWNNTATPDRWELEYGESGFAQGRGSLITVWDSSAIIADLDFGTDYDFYVRGLCGDTAYTDWVFTNCHTDTVPRVTGIDQLGTNQVRFYPNPTSGRIVVETGDMQVERLTLYSIEGKELLMLTDVKNETVVELPNPGLFVIELQSRNGKIYQKVNCIK